MFQHAWVQKVANRIDPKLFGRAMKKETFDDELIELVRVCLDQPSPQPVKVNNMPKEVLSVDDLPVVGDPELTYKVTSTLDLYRWVNNEYVPYNPYIDSTMQTIDSRETIIDPSASMPSISEETLKDGRGDLRLSVVYNIHALREDLRRLAERNINLGTLIPRSLRVKPADINSVWLATNHSTLVHQLRQVVKGKNNYNTYVVEGLNRLGIDVWFDTDKKKIGFKDDSFVAMV